ncbi:MAG: HIRAN domain-containing protein [Paracoccaceae bacterium]
MAYLVQKWVGWNFCGWIRVAGVTSYRKHAEHIARFCVEDDIFNLVREPDNDHDRNAVMVVSGSDQIGYVDKFVAAALSKSYSNEMPIRALFKRGYLGESGAIAIDILPQMPSAIERRLEGWQLERNH